MITREGVKCAIFDDVGILEQVQTGCKKAREGRRMGEEGWGGERRVGGSCDRVRNENFGTHENS